MLSYILQIILFQALFFIVYEFFLKKETFFTGNRIYLLATQLLVLILPLLRFSKIEENISLKYKNFYTKSYISISRTVKTSVINEQDTFQFQWEWLLYLGSLIMLALFVFKIFRIIKIYHNNEKVKKVTHTQIYLQDNNNNSAFSFLDYIFVGKHICEDKQEEIIAHELVHIRKNHSYDLLFFEIIKIIYWYNPFIYFFQKRVTEIHEYQVDREITLSKTAKPQYFSVLLSEVFKTEKVEFVSSFYNKSLIKKRIEMLKKLSSSNKKLYKYVIVIPILLLLISYVAVIKKAENRIESRRFASITKTSKFEKKRPKKYSYLQRTTKSKKSSNAPSCLNIKPVFDFKVNNFFKLINPNTNWDAVAFLYASENISDFIKKDQLIRIAYIEKNKQHSFKSIPKGKYYLKIGFGNNWVQKNVDGMCVGSFHKNASYKVATKIFDFGTTSKYQKVSHSISYTVNLNTIPSTTIESLY